MMEINALMTWPTGSVFIREKGMDIVPEVDRPDLFDLMSRPWTFSVGRDGEDRSRATPLRISTAS